MSETDSRIRRIMAEKPSFKLTLRDVVGGTLSHAYLFSGASNVTLELFRLTASALFCESPDGEGRPCGKCVQCRRVFENRHPNVLFYPVGDKYKVEDDADDIVRQSFIHPLEEGEKLIVLRRAETMSPAVQNKLLKTLEEPPKGTHIFLLARGTGGLLPTVLSRSKTVDAGSISQNEMLEIITGGKPATGRQRTVSALCSGDVELCEKLLTDRGFALFEFCLDNAVKMKTVADYCACSTNATKFRDRLSEMLDFYAVIFSEALGCFFGETPSLPQREEIMSISRAFSKASVMKLIAVVNECRDKARFNCNFNFVSDSILLCMLGERQKTEKGK